MSDDTHLVSVVIAAHNAERYVAEAIDSVLAQDHAVVEVVFVDDGSTDATAEIAQSAGPRLRYLHQRNQGVGTARNRGVDHARGPFLSFLDADDRFVADKLARQLTVLNAKPATDAVYGRVTEFLSADLSPKEREQHRVPLGDRRAPGPASMLIRRAAFERVGPFATDRRRAVSLDWAARAADTGLPASWLDDVLVERRLHAHNLGLDEPGRTGDFAHVLQASIVRRRRRAGGGPVAPDPGAS